jgi:hypothetical protein
VSAIALDRQHKVVVFPASDAVIIGCFWYEFLNKINNLYLKNKGV